MLRTLMIFGIRQNKWYVVSEHGPEKHPGPYSFREAHQTASFPVPRCVNLYGHHAHVRLVTGEGEVLVSKVEDPTSWT